MKFKNLLYSQVLEEEGQMEMQGPDGRSAQGGQRKTASDTVTQRSRRRACGRGQPYHTLVHLVTYCWSQPVCGDVEASGKYEVLKIFCTLCMCVCVSVCDVLS